MGLTDFSINLRKLSNFAKNTARRIYYRAFGRRKKKENLDKEITDLYSSRDYIEAYAEHTNLIVMDNPEDAIGGMWSDLGKLQFDFLKSQGLKPKQKLLDIGCGTLRGGRLFIRYLDRGNYYGMDISEEAIAWGKELVEREGLSGKSPQLAVNKSKNLKLNDYKKEAFDYIFAQSVFSHLPKEMIIECFENIGNVMTNNGSFFFTFLRARNYGRIGIRDYAYPFSFFQKAAEQFNFVVEDYSKNYLHPRGQIMVRLSNK
jgi:SAM-dependent methyltransferase